MFSYFPEGILINTPNNKDYFESFESLDKAFSNGAILEAKAILCDSNHNLIVDLECMKGFIPKNEGALGIESGETKDIALISKVGKPIAFKISYFTKDKDGKPVAVLSRKAAQIECIEKYIKSLSKGDIITAKVTHLEHFGAFVDIGCGVPSLIPIDTISVSRISHPADRFAVGDIIKAVVKDIDESGRVYLSHKELLGTWNENASLFCVGETVDGIIRSVEDYGIFIELTPNLAGLAEPKENACVGQHASVYIKSVIPDKMKIKLVIVDVFESKSNPIPLNYFYKGNHIDRWQYSTDESNKLIVSDFG